MALSKRQRKERLGHGRQTQIAKSLGFSTSTVSNVINNRTQMYAKETVRLVRHAVAEQIGAPVEEVFGKAAA